MKPFCGYYQILAAFVFLTLMPGHAFAQKSAELNRLDEKLARHLEKKMPEWKHERGEPIAGSDDSVLIEFWSSPNRRSRFLFSCITRPRWHNKLYRNMRDIFIQ